MVRFVILLLNPLIAMQLLTVLRVIPLPPQDLTETVHLHNYPLSSK